ncbi:histidine kinase [Clostridium botulinum]|uniref:sensor histidine kinase n=1 Tax=Clostridium botulinum TaxID=1491 RepID=UPI0005976FD7|nr:HAMP domain-containing sensor histidine kinase [Clostridium botulinum]KIL08585.1 histidine kinase [Clostridium botulinum]MBY6934950.1 HAMP domain-containing histidine kinase [Clostridium botulinum]NFL81988.1 HAMP domain-containing histidine kinase [Clostridium botulinum]NFN12005.1 HAMP domain-containing histidine kinase [Clostridium botulinum]NFO36785.1 HAMP domain-containing histidine kinase [Clostridium botulinum]
MDIRLKKKFKVYLKSYLKGIYLIDILLMALITGMLFSSVLEYKDFIKQNNNISFIKSIFNEEEYETKKLYEDSKGFSQIIYETTDGLYDLLTGSNEIKEKIGQLMKYFNNDVEDYTSQFKLKDNVYFIIRNKHTKELYTNDPLLDSSIKYIKENQIDDLLNNRFKKQGVVSIKFDNEKEYNYLVSKGLVNYLDDTIKNFEEVYYTSTDTYKQELINIRKEVISLSILLLVYLFLIIKTVLIIARRGNKEEKIKSNILNNIVFVIKNGFKYKETSKTLLLSLGIIIIILITYLYFLATGGYENNIFVRFFQTYPFKGTILIITGLILMVIFTVKKTLDIAIINEGLKKLNEGNLDEDIPVFGSITIKELINNINLIKEGYKNSLYERVKDEKLKTELISNVSHDLKTPLTSIINYVNILKNKDITEDERKDYLAILDSKSLKLKSLIDDLFEMSKINSGKITLNKDKIDILSLIHQGIGEYSFLYEYKNITFKVISNEEDIFMELDGKLISRALENIIINALKYSLDNTRVYIEIEKHDERVEIIVKNIANYEMDFDEEEIFERFARADKSRNSSVEGSGLGLAITKSIVELHDGKTKIEREGDMFKIYIILPLNNKNC